MDRQQPTKVSETAEILHKIERLNGQISDWALLDPAITTYARRVRVQKMVAFRGRLNAQLPPIEMVELKQQVTATPSTLRRIGSIAGRAVSNSALGYMFGVGSRRHDES